MRAKTLLSSSKWLAGLCCLVCLLLLPMPAAAPPPPMAPPFSAMLTLPSTVCSKPVPIVSFDYNFTATARTFPVGVVKGLDECSLNLFRAVVTDERFPTVAIDMFDAQGVKTLTIELEQAHISELGTAETSGAVAANRGITFVETVRFLFTSIKLTSFGSSGGQVRCDILTHKC